MSGPKATMRDRAAITRFFGGLRLLEPGMVQPQQWRPEPGALSPPTGNGLVWGRREAVAHRRPNRQAAVTLTVAGHDQPRRARAAQPIITA